MDYIDGDEEVDLVLPVGVDDIDENGEIDPRVTEAVIRQLGKYCAVHIAQDASEEEIDDDDEACESRLSHRSHDNIGYVASPLIDTQSLHDPDDEDGMRPKDSRAEHRRAFSEHEIR